MKASPPITAAPQGNANYWYTRGSIGPMRVGIFAANSSNSGRITAGASYYGIMELSGNLWERPVTIGNATGRGFTGLHGNGALDPSGAANVSNWPGTDAVGAGFRGGNWSIVAAYLCVSNRGIAANTHIRSVRTLSVSGRCVRRRYYREIMMKTKSMLFLLLITDCCFLPFIPGQLIWGYLGAVTAGATPWRKSWAR